MPEWPAGPVSAVRSGNLGALAGEALLPCWPGPGHLTAWAGSDCPAAGTAHGPARPRGATQAPGRPLRAGKAGELLVSLVRHLSSGRSQPRSKVGAARDLAMVVRFGPEDSHPNGGPFSLSRTLVQKVRAIQRVALLGDEAGIADDAA